MAKAITAKEPQTLRLPNKAAGVLMCTHGTSGSVSPPLCRLFTAALNRCDRVIAAFEQLEGQVFLLYVACLALYDSG